VPGQPSSSNWASGLIASTDFAVGPDGSLWWLAQFAPSFAPQSGSLHKILSTVPPATVVDPMPAAWGLRVSPNPFRSTTELAVGSPAVAAVDLAIYDLGGRRVRALFSGTLPAGSRSFAWDGTDDHGVAVGPGVYFARIRGDGAAVMTRRVLRVN